MKNWDTEPVEVYTTESETCGTDFSHFRGFAKRFFVGKYRRFISFYWVRLGEALFYLFNLHFFLKHKVCNDLANQGIRVIVAGSKITFSPYDFEIPSTKGKSSFVFDF